MEPQASPPVQQVVKAVSGFDIRKVWPYILGGFLVVSVGIGTAWMISGRTPVKPEGGATGTKVTDTEAGRLDPKIKYDNATGTLLEGGIGNEGTFHLDRDAGPTKFVYLTSSVVDLNKFLNKKVEIWGETLASKKAGWLMDVAKIQVVQ